MWSVTKLKKVNISSYPKHAQHLLKQAVEILRCIGGLCRPLQVFRANHLSEEFRHQTKDDVKLTSAQMSQLVSFFWFFAVSENPTFDFRHCTTEVWKTVSGRNCCEEYKYLFNSSKSARCSIEDFRHQTKDNVKLTSAHMSQLVGLGFFAVSENLIVSTFGIVLPKCEKLFQGVIVCKYLFNSSKLASYIL